MHLKRSNGSSVTRLAALAKQNLVLVCLVALAIIAGSLTPYFWTAGNLQNIASQAAIPALLALGACFVIASGQIDLSVGSILALAGLVFGVVANWTDSFVVASLAAVSVGAICGLVNGAVSSWIPSFIVTLATMVSFRGLALGLTEAQSVNLIAAPPRLDALGIPWPAVLAAACAGLAIVAFRRTRFGLHVLAVGSNETAAWNVGLNIRRVRIMAFALSGAAAGLGAALLTLRLGAARPTAGVGYELDAIAAAIVGGAALSGGKVSITGAVAATLLFSMIKNSLTLLNVSSALQQVSIGVILIIVVLTRTLGSREFSQEDSSRLGR